SGRNGSRTLTRPCIGASRITTGGSPMSHWWKLPCPSVLLIIGCSSVGCRNSAAAA
ncbi:hypothetical protein HAX54_035922, partial [Datura stramonium]|nr:hypothetical protein [Datura stramonium]